MAENETRPDRLPDAGSAADRAFARFCRSGDPADLAEVFDGTAPRLVLVAMHLVRDAADAEDLVQTTFVEAIRSRRSFEPGRPVLPWLLTILGRRARNHRREHARRRAERLVPAALAAPDPGPGERTAAAEVMERVAAALERVDEPFRQVLVLRLVHGLRSIEIARALGRPAGTVHAQLHRGLQRLRAHLPRGLAVPAALLLGTGEGLAAVRARVLRAVPVGVAPVAAVTGGVAVKYLMGVGAAVVLGVLLVLWNGAGARGLESEIQGDLGPGPVAVDLGRAGADGGGGALSSDPSGGVRSGRMRTEVEDEERVVVTGRVVDGPGGPPLAGAGVRLWGYEWGGNDDRLPGSWNDPEPVVTGVDGRFAVAFVPDERVGISMSIEAPGRGRAPVSFGWSSDLRPGARLPLGDVPLLPGTATVLRAVDEDGRPVAGFSVQLRRRKPLDSLYPPGVGGFGTSLRRTDEDGLLPPVVLPAGAWKIDTDSTVSGYRLLGPWVFTVGPGKGEKTVVLRLGRPEPERTIAGRVVGGPLAEVRLTAHEPGEPRYEAATRSAPDGTFFFRELGEPGDLLVLALASGDRRYEILEPGKPVAVGTRDVEVVLHRLEEVAVRLRVVDADNGEPVERFRFALVPCRDIERERMGGTWIDGSPRMSPLTDRPAGRARLSVLPGSYAVLVQPASPRHAEVLGQRIHVPSSAGALEVEVPVARRVDWTARVVDRAGEPVVGSEVQLLQRVGRGEPYRWVHSLEAALDEGRYNALLTLITSSDETDEHGLARLSSGPDLAHAALRVTGEDHEPRRILLGALPRTLPFSVVVRRGAVLEGRLGPDSFLAAWGPSDRQRERWSRYRDGEQELDDYRPRIVAASLDDPDADSVEAVLDDEGWFRLAPVPPGDWRLAVHLSSHEWKGSSRELALRAVEDLRSGEVRRVNVDAAHLVPGRLRGRVFLDGVPWTEGTLRFESERARMRVAPAPDGTFATDRMVPGEYLARLRSDRPAGGRLRLPGTMILGVTSGDTVHRDLRFTRQSLTVELRGSSGSPVPDRFVSLQLHQPHPLNEDSVMLRPRETDQDGRVVFESVPAGRLDVVVWEPDRDADDARIGLRGARRALAGERGADVPRFVRLGPVSVSAGGQENVTLRLP